MVLLRLLPFSPALLIFTGLFGLVSCNEKTAGIQPNIIIILTDDQGWGDLGISGNDNIRTPNIDRLAGSGVRFDRFYVSPVCSPTRAELLTGRYHVRSGVYSTSAGGERMDADETTIADVFKDAGYATAAYGKWHNGMQAPYHPSTRGFDDYYGFASGHWGNYFNPILEHNGRIVRGDGFLVDDLTQHGMDFMEANSDRPFLLYLPYNTPHSPMQVPDRWYDPVSRRPLVQFHREPQNEDTLFTKAALAMCENIDYNVGRVMDKVRDLGLLENTIIIYLSDNGPNGNRWNDGMKGRKGSTDEGGVRSPAILSWPGTVPANKLVGEICGAIDLLPTLADMSGIEVNTVKPLDGISVKAAILGEKRASPDRKIYTYWQDRLSVRTQRFRLDHEDRLYDMETDPGQMRPVNDRFPEAASDLIASKRKWERDVLIELPAKDLRPFVIGHPAMPFTQIPARDGIAHGNIRRSNRWPNCSFFENWTDIEDKITWDVEVAESGDFDVTMYYTCPSENLGAEIQLSLGEATVAAIVEDAHDPPLTGMADDRTPRMESYVKDFRPMKLGNIYLEQGTGTLTLQATRIPGDGAVDFRLLMLERR